MYFIFKGIKSTEMGVTVLTQPPIKSPESRTWDSFIDNKDGADSLFLGYKPIELSMEIAVEGKENLDRVLGWLDGEGQLIRSDFPDRYRNVHIIEGIELNMIHPELWQGSFTYLVVDPYWYKVGDEWYKVREGTAYHGWDKFVPYGSGKNYVENWDFRETITNDFSREEWDFEHDGNRLLVVQDREGNSKHVDLALRPRAPLGEYIVRFSMAAYKDSWFGIGGGRIINQDKIVGDGKERVYECVVRVTSDAHDILIGHSLAGDNGFLTYAINWVQITPVDNQHLVVEKTPLKNGLTRIQTWGGNDRIKLRLLDADMLAIGKPYTTSIYIEYNLDNKAYLYQNLGGIIPDKQLTKGFHTTFQEKTTGKLGNIMIRSKTVNENLDFIASDPQIVEGEASYPSYPIARDIVIDKIGTIESSIDEGYKIVKLNKDVHSGEIKVTTTMLPSVHTDNILVSYWYDSNLIKEEIVKVSREGKVHSKHTVVEGKPVNRVYLYKDTTFESSKSKEAIYLGTEITVSYKEFPDVDGYVENEGNTKSYPTLHLKNNSKDTNVVRLNINDSIIRYEFPQGETEVFINLMGMRAGTEPTHTGYYRHDVRDKYLYVERDKGMHLNPGPNTITSDGDVEIRLLRKDRWI